MSKLVEEITGSVESETFEVEGFGCFTLEDLKQEGIEIIKVPGSETNFNKKKAQKRIQKMAIRMHMINKRAKDKAKAASES